MLLSKILRPDLVRIPLDAENPMEAISELVDVLVQAHEIPYSRRDDVLDALREHEQHLTSGAAEGVAVPHLETDKVSDLLCAMGVSKKGVAFRTRDGHATHFVVLLLVTSQGYVAEVETMKDITKALENPVTREAIRSAHDAPAVLDILRKAEQN